jgi:hypothetical protein
MASERFICAGEPQFGDPIFYNGVQRTHIYGNRWVLNADVTPIFRRPTVQS